CGHGDGTFVERIARPEQIDDAPLPRGCARGQGDDSFLHDEQDLGPGPLPDDHVSVAEPAELPGPEGRDGGQPRPFTVAEGERVGNSTHATPPSRSEPYRGAPTRFTRRHVFLERGVGRTTGCC